jgi:hypothetical protein
MAAEAAMPDDSPSYEPQDAIGRATRTALLSGAAGLFLAAVQNSTTRSQVGAFGVFTRFGRTISLTSREHNRPPNPMQATLF